MGKPTPLYLTPGNGTSFALPTTAGNAADVSDPAKPVPFIPRAISMAAPEQWKPWLVHDQRFVSDRPEVVRMNTNPSSTNRSRPSTSSTPICRASNECSKYAEL